MASPRPNTIKPKYSAGPNSSASLVSGAPIAAMTSVATVPAKNEAMAAIPSAMPAWPLRAMACPSSVGDHRGGFARDVDQDRGGRAAVLGAVIDARQHDERAGRIDLEGERHQHGDGRDRADARAARRSRCRPGSPGSRARDWSATARWQSRARDCRSGRTWCAPSVADQPRRERDRQPERELEQADAERGHQRAEDEGFSPTHLVAGERADHDRRAVRRQRDRADGRRDRRPPALRARTAARGSTSARAATRLPAPRRARAARRAGRAAPPGPSAACPGPCRRMSRSADRRPARRRIPRRR